MFLLEESTGTQFNVESCLQFCELLDECLSFWMMIDMFFAVCVCMC